MKRRNFVQNSAIASMGLSILGLTSFKFSSNLDESELIMMKSIEEQLSGDHLSAKMSKKYLRETFFYPKQKIESISGEKLIFINKNDNKIIIEKKSNRYILKILSTR